MNTPDQLNQLGESLRAVGRIDEAIRAFESALQLNPKMLEAVSNLGHARVAQGRHPDALRLFERAVSIKSLPETHFNFGNALAQSGRLDDAIAQWEVTLKLQPQHRPALRNIGAAYFARRQFEQANQARRRMVEMHPDFVDGYIDYSESLVASKDIEHALEFAAQAVRIDPNSSRALANLGFCYLRLEDYTQARQWLERANQLEPGNPKLALALAHVFYVCKQPEQSIEVLERALRFHPNHPQLRFIRSTNLLTVGRYREGFEEYETRWLSDDVPHPMRSFRAWDGSDLTGRKILVHDEQGFGDAIQFARYIPMLLAHNAQVLVVVRNELKRLFESLSDRIEVVPIGMAPPRFDCYVMLPSLARAFQTSIETIPAAVPYLHPSADLIDAWRPLIQSHAVGKKVGLVWGGFASPGRRRSCALRDLAPLADVSGLSWFSLQLDKHREQLSEAPAGMKIFDLGKDINDFADSAAAMAQMDLIITIDTAAAHLAGALGLKTWVMLPYAPDWRWLLDGESTPWYPTMKLFRQKSRDDWGSVVQQIKSELQAFVQ